MRSSSHTLLLVTVGLPYSANQTLVILRHIGAKPLQYLMTHTVENHDYNAWIQKHGLDILLDTDPLISIASGYRH
jgi:hypothetical protein